MKYEITTQLSFQQSSFRLSCNLPATLQTGGAYLAFKFSYVHDNLENMGVRYNPVKVDELVLDVNFPCLIGYKPRGIRLLPSNQGWPKLFPNPDAEREVIFTSVAPFPPDLVSVSGHNTHNAQRC